MSNPVKVGIVGFGRVAGMHLERMKQEDGCFEFAAVCDMNEARRQAAEEAGFAWSTADLDEFLKQDLELVLITTHSSAHYEPAKACLEAGKNIVVEKPVTVRAAEGEELFKLAEEKNLVMLVHHNRRFDADYQEVKKLVREKGVGEMVLVENRVGGARPAVGFGTPEFNQQWRITKNMGGGTLMDFGPHWTDQVLDLVQEKVVGIFADVRRVKWGDADDYFNILILFENNTRAVVSKADFVFAAHPKWLIYGSEATVWRDAENKIHWKKDDEEEIAEPFETPPSLHRNYYEVIRNGAEPLIDPKGSLRVAQVLDAAMVSAEKREFLRVEI